MSHLVLHVRHQATPERCLEFLQAIARELPTDGIITPEEQGTRLRALDLIAGKGAALGLTPLGRCLAAVGDQDPALAYELLYWLHYARWDTAEHRPELAWAWSFQTVCTWLAEQGSVPVPAKGKGKPGSRDGKSVRDMLAVDVAQRARDELRFDDDADSGPEISFSPDSIEGVFVWLRALAGEPVFEDDVFRLRRACPPTLVVLACDRAARQVGERSGLGLMTLSDPARARIAHACLLDPQALDAMLDYTARIYPDLLQARSSNYGRQIVMPRLGLTVVDVVRP